MARKDIRKKEENEDECRQYMSIPFGPTVTIDLLLNSLKLTSKNIIPVSLLYVQFFKHNPSPRDN